MNEFLQVSLIIGIYLLGIPIAYAIMEDPNDKGPFEAAPMMSILWPIIILYGISIILGYPFYRITKKIKNKLKP